MPESLRVKGRLILAMREPNEDEAEMCFARSLKLSRHQGARGWELRSAIDSAVLLDAQGRRERAVALLRPVFDQFVEDDDTADLKAAKRLLSIWD
jgi:hypothetical protein